MGKFRNIAKGLKNIVERQTHEVPTGPHTDVRKRKINPSFRNPDVESGRTKERKRKSKVMGMGVKNVVKRMVGQKEGGRAGYQGGGRTGLKHGTQRKVLTGDHPIVKALAGGVEGKPHSSKEGRLASAKRKLRSRIGRTSRRPVPWKKGKRAPFQGEGYAKGGRAGYAIGSVAKIGKEGIKRFLKFIKTGKDIDKHGTKINIDKVVKRLKKQGSPGIETYFESTGKYPKGVHARNKESKKLFKTVQGKASGGRIGLSHGGSAGAAKRGHGAEIK